MKPDGQNPDKAEDDSTVNYWGVAWWNSRTLEWFLDPKKLYTKESAEGHMNHLKSEYPDVPHRLVMITDHFSYTEV